MIPELEEQYNHTKANLSISIADREDGQPARTTVRTACPPATRGFTLEDIQAIEEGIEHAYEGTAPLPTTDKPRLVTRGPLSEEDTKKKIPCKQSTSHDWITFTAKEPYWVMQELVELTCPGAVLIKKDKGINGYHSGIDILKDKKKIAAIYYGSHHNERQNQKCQLLITGGGNTDNFNLVDFYRYAMVMKSSTLTRTDVKYDDFYGNFTIEKLTQAHLDGKFKTTNAPKNPKITPYGCIQPDGSNFGRSVYIGSTGSSKMLRGYEKAYERLKAILNSEEEKDRVDRHHTMECFTNGQEIEWEGVNNDQPFKLTDWFRLEVQFTNGNTIIPLDILINPDYYFAGAYPYLKEVLEMEETRAIPRLKRNDELDLMIRIANIKAIAGSTIDDMLVMGWSNDEIVEALKGGKGASQKLIKSGAYREC